MSDYMRFVHLLLFLIQPWKIFGTQTCYFPDGNVAVDDTPCTSNAVNICCQTNATCLGNGLCFDPFGSAVGGYIRGSCTDKTWQASSCPQYCTYDNATSGLYNSLSDAGIVSCTSTDFCCESDPTSRCNCQTGNGTFTLTGGLLPFTTIGPSSTSSSTSSSTPSVTSTTSSTSTASSAATTSTSSTTPTSSAAPGNSNSEALKVGLGVGLPLGIALVGTIGLLAFFLRRRQKRAAAYDPNTVQPTHPPVYYKPENNQVHEAPTQPYSDTPVHNRISEVPGIPIERGQGRY